MIYYYGGQIFKGVYVQDIAFKCFFIPFVKETFKEVCALFWFKWKIIIWTIQRWQAGNKLNVSEIIIEIEIEEVFRIFWKFTGYDCQNIILAVIFIKYIYAFHYSDKGTIIVDIFSEVISIWFIAIKWDPDKEIMFFEEYCPVIIQKGSIGLYRIAGYYFWVFSQFIDEVSEKV